MANEKRVYVLIQGSVIFGIYTNILAVYTRLNKTVPNTTNNGVPSYMTVYRGVNSSEKYFSLHTCIGTFTIEKHNVYKKAF